MKRCKHLAQGQAPCTRFREQRKLQRCRAHTVVTDVQPAAVLSSRDVGHILRTPAQLIGNTPLVRSECSGTELQAIHATVSSPLTRSLTLDWT